MHGGVFTERGLKDSGRVGVTRFVEIKVGVVSASDIRDSLHRPPDIEWLKLLITFAVDPEAEVGQFMRLLDQSNNVFVNWFLPRRAQSVLSTACYLSLTRPVSNGLPQQSNVEAFRQELRRGDDFGTGRNGVAKAPFWIANHVA